MWLSFFLNFFFQYSNEIQKKKEGKFEKKEVLHTVTPSLDKVAASLDEAATDCPDPTESVIKSRRVGNQN